MIEKILLREYKNHIEGYGRMDDLVNDTICGYTKEELSQYSKVWTEFEPDPNIPKHKVGKKNPGLYDIPYIEIPMGTLRVYGEY